MAQNLTLFDRRSILQSASALLVSGEFAHAQEVRPAMVVAVADLPAGLEPARDMGNVGTRILFSFFDTLIRRDFLSAPGGAGAELKPALATSWERKSPSELIVRLRQGVKFHNGDEMTSEDVAFTFSEERMWGPKPLIPDARNYFGHLDAVEAIDRYTVRFHTRVPDVLLEQRLASWTAWVVNKKAYVSQGMETFARNAVGTGPYKLRKFVSDTTVLLDAHDDYWMGKPTARSVEFRKVPEVSTRVAGIVSGEFDMITNIPPDQLDILARYKDTVDTRSVVLANAHLLIYNMQDKVIADRRIRQALNYAIDRQMLVDTLWNGGAKVPASHNFAEYGQMFLSDHKLPFDPAKARALLKDAGYKGEKIVYRTMPNYYTNALPAAEILLEMWKTVGINAELQVVESFAQMSAAGMQIGNTSNSVRLPDPLGSLWVSWSPEASSQITKQWTADSAKKFNEAGRELVGETDPAKRRALFDVMLTEWETEAPATLLYQPLETYGVKKSVKWQPYTFYYMDFRPYNLAFGK